MQFSGILYHFYIPVRLWLSGFYKTAMLPREFAGAAPFSVDLFTIDTPADTPDISGTQQVYLVLRKCLKGRYVKYLEITRR